MDPGPISLLRPIVGWFTEGLSTPDLALARRVLEGGDVAA